LADDQTVLLVDDRFVVFLFHKHITLIYSALKKRDNVSNHIHVLLELLSDEFGWNLVCFKVTLAVINFVEEVIQGFFENLQALSLDLVLVFFFILLEALV
jgi:hypothetical protein